MLENILARFGALFSSLGHIGLLGPLLGPLLGCCLGALGVFLGLRLAPGGSGRAEKAEARRQWARRLADAAFDGLLLHRNGTVLQMNRALVRMLGYREAELLGTPFANLASGDQMAMLRTELEAPAPQIALFTLQHADRREIFVELASHNLELDGLPVTVTAIRDVSAFRQLEARLDYLTHNDGLTGLPNAAMLFETLQAALARNDAAGGTTAMLTLQLGSLKAVNAQFGRKGGDMLLRQVANRLSALADHDMVARLSGSHFAIVLPHAGAPNRTASLTSQIEAALAEPVIVEGKAVRAMLAIGVAIYPEHATSAEGLIEASLFALGKAVEHGGSHMFSHAEIGREAAGQPAAPPPKPSLVVTQR